MSDRPRRATLGLAAWTTAIVAAALGLPVPGIGRGPSRSLDPAAWGGDHVGQGVPDYLTGDECLFCHRMDIGPGFATNRHNITIRPIGDEPGALKALKQGPETKELADAVIYLMGGPRRQRYLKASRAYGRLDLLSTQWQPPHSGLPGRLVDAERPRWDSSSFADACAGCHATAVDAATRAFSTASLDCYVCHGVVGPKHSKGPTLVLLSRARRDPPRVAASICAQCHLRTGRSRSTGLPYPNTFVAGDNLFRDFAVDLSPADVAKLHPADRHIYENTRDVVSGGDERVTCLSCHDVHRRSTAEHQKLARRDLCLNCHDATGRQTTFDPDDLHSPACRY